MAKSHGLLTKPCVANGNKRETAAFEFLGRGYIDLKFPVLNDNNEAGRAGVSQLRAASTSRKRG